ncbi:AMP-binding protein [Paraburkholderia fungorum]|uniref:AMP-binding protein n=1 Tax=Paraburkholderia fungorum TaxID=134537 RepID=UPI001C1F0E52|nr:AMP-binding protein [Paraburkholderia fungorum]MBU7440235.1 AMP-binding protein [Paraburkholderia fungorum]
MSTRPETTLAALIANRVETMPDLDVLTVEGAGARPDEVRTYRQLWENGQRLAQVLIDLGLRPGEHFGLLMANHAEFVDAMVAASISGTVFVPIDPRAKGEKLAFMLASAQCRGVIAADYTLNNLLAIRSSLEQLSWVVGLESDEGARPLADFRGVLSLRALLPERVPQLDTSALDPDGAMQLIFTSGTTGDPKGIVMTHRRYCATSAAVSALFGYAPDDRPYSGLSLTHANAQIVTLGASLTAGMRAVLSRRFTKSRLWDIARTYRCTTFTLLGGMTTAIYSEPAKLDDADNPVRFVISAGMPAAVWSAFEHRFGIRIVEFYGAAEGGLTVNPAGDGPVGSIGKPVPSLKHRIVDEDGNDCAPGAPGELLFRPVDGSSFKVEYFGNPEASAKKCRDGWLHMGDVVREDENGWLFFEYRKGGGIRHNGEFVNSAAIEKVIAESGLVEDVYVYGVKAASGAPGEKDVVAAVVPKDAAGFDPQQVFRACRATLEASSVISWLQMVPQIPKTASEKPLERYLIEMFDTQRDSVIAERP